MRQVDGFNVVIFSENQLYHVESVEWVDLKPKVMLALRLSEKANGPN